MKIKWIQRLALRGILKPICEKLGLRINVPIKRNRIEDALLFLDKHDPLTGLSNRSDFEDNFSRALIKAKRHTRLLGIVYVDLDSFKEMINQLGSEKGDVILQMAAERLRNVVRKTDFLARFGGDEFIILLTQVASFENITGIVGKIIESFEKPFLLEGNEYAISVSIGISVYPRDGQDTKTLLQHADIAMYLAKSRGGNNFQFCPSTFAESVVRKIKLSEDLARALSKNEFELYYQPIVNIHNNKLTGFEALIRWNHPNGQLLMPGEFIDIAEENHLIQAIGEWLIHTACLQAKALHTAGFGFIQVAVNISAIQLTRHFINIVSQTLKNVQLKPEYLIIEMTETKLMENCDSNIYLLQALKELGVKISIDDFGTGYSSLAYLIDFSINSLKIDKRFISVLTEDTKSSVIIDAIISMAHSLKMKVVAEGVEKQEQLDRLRDKQCDEYQGNLFSPPLASKDLIAFLKRI